MYILLLKCVFAEIDNKSHILCSSVLELGCVGGVGSGVGCIFSVDVSLV